MIVSSCKAHQHFLEKFLRNFKAAEFVRLQRERKGRGYIFETKVMYYDARHVVSEFVRTAQERESGLAQQRRVVLPLAQRKEKHKARGRCEVLREQHDLLLGHDGEQRQKALHLVGCTQCGQEGL